MIEEREQGKPGPFFEDFLREQGTYEEATEQAIKRVIAFQLAELMREQSVTKVEMAKRLETSRSQLDRLLDPEDGNVTIATLAHAARALGRSIKLELA